MIKLQHPGRLHYHRLRRHRVPEKPMDPNIQFSCISNHFDIILSIDHKIQAGHIKCFWRHVKDHQDNYLGPLERWDTLNATCDMVTKHRW